jgi:hypothetical protein
MFECLECVLNKLPSWTGVVVLIAIIIGVVCWLWFRGTEIA